MTARAVSTRGIVTFSVATIVLSAAAAANALAAPNPPPNDDRADATPITLPGTASGTMVGATIEPSEADSECASTIASVWYEITVGPTAPSRIGLKLAAGGNLDAAIDVYQRQRSQLHDITCQRTDTNGQAALAFQASPNSSYLIRVAQLSNSDPGPFSLKAIPLAPPPSPPGRRFGRRGAIGILDGTFDLSAAYSMRLAAGTTYKVNLVKPDSGCISLDIFPPGTYSFSQQSSASLTCAGYTLFTPTASGTWSFLIRADTNNPGTQRYGLHVLPATTREMAPGIPLPNLSHVNGYLHGNVDDVVRLFRFDVTAHSDLVVFLRAASTAPFDLKLLDDSGHYMQCRCGSRGEETIRRQISPGRYFAVVQAESFGSGPFTLFRQSRTITHVAVTFGGKLFEQVTPGTAIPVIAKVTPAVNGPVTVEIDYFDPVARWQFRRDYHLQAVHGVATMQFLPPFVGRWRASVSFDGTPTSAPATSAAFANVFVAGPLQQLAQCGGACREMVGR
jgi:hypothetical protein